jgi:hypothetical protein
MKLTKEIAKLLAGPGGSEPAGMAGQRPRTRAKAQAGAFRVRKPARLRKYLGPDFLAVLFPENKEADAAGIPRGQTPAEAAKDTRYAAPRSLGKISWDVYRAGNPRSLALALLLD